MKTKLIIGILISIFFLSFISAWNFEDLKNWNFQKEDIGTTNNTYYNNTGGNDTFIANYSTFLTHITWVNVMNGTLLQSSQWNSTNTSYMTGDNFTLQNISMNNYVLYVNSTNGAGSGIDTDTFVANYSQFILNNESLTNYILFNNQSVENYILYVNSTNTGIDTDTFVQNYSQFFIDVFTSFT